MFQHILITLCHLSTPISQVTIQKNKIKYALSRPAGRHELVHRDLPVLVVLVDSAIALDYRTLIEQSITEPPSYHRLPYPNHTNDCFTIDYLHLRECLSLFEHRPFFAPLTFYASVSFMNPYSLN